jgi:hypothetical protein
VGRAVSTKGTRLVSDLFSMFGMIFTTNSTASTRCPNCGTTYPLGWWHSCPIHPATDEIAFLRAALIQAHERIDRLEEP